MRWTGVVGNYNVQYLDDGDLCMHIKSFRALILDRRVVSVVLLAVMAVLLL